MYFALISDESEDQVDNPIDLTIEKWREYRFASGIVRIENPRTLYISPNDSHRVEDAAGLGHYIPPGWIHLRWEPRDKSKAIVF